MQVIEINDLHAESFETRLARLPHVFGTCVEPAVGLRMRDEAELGRKHDAVASSAHGAPDEPFVGVRAVNVRRIEECYAQIEGAKQGGETFLLIWRPIPVAHSH